MSSNVEIKTRNAMTKGDAKPFILEKYILDIK